MAVLCKAGLVITRPVNDAVLKAIAQDALRPAVVTAVLDSYLELLLPKNIDTRVEDLRRELRVLDAKIANLVKALEVAGGDLEPVVTQLSQRQQERDALRSELASAATFASDSGGPPDDRGRGAGGGRELARPAKRIAPGRTTDVAGSVGRALRFEPDGRAYRFSGRVATGRLIAGAVLPTYWNVPNRGCA